MKKKTKKILGLTLGGLGATATVVATSVALVACAPQDKGVVKAVSIEQAMNEFQDNASNLVGDQTIFPSELVSGWLPGQAPTNQSGNNTGVKGTSAQITNVWNALSFRPVLFSNQYRYYFSVQSYNDATGVATIQVSVFDKNSSRAISTNSIMVSGFLNVTAYNKMLSGVQVSLNGGVATLTYPRTAGTGANVVRKGIHKNTFATTQSSTTTVGSTIIVPKEIWATGSGTLPQLSTQQVGNNTIIQVGTNKVYPVTTVKVGQTNVVAMVIPQQVTQVTTLQGGALTGVQVVKINNDSVPTTTGTSTTALSGDGLTNFSNSSQFQKLLHDFPLSTTYLMSDESADGVYAAINPVDSLGNSYEYLYGAGMSRSQAIAEANSGQTPEANAQPQGNLGVLTTGSINTFGENQNTEDIPFQTVFYRYATNEVNGVDNITKAGANVQIFGAIPAELNTGDYVTLPTSVVNPQWIENPAMPINVFSSTKSSLPESTSTNNTSSTTTTGANVAILATDDTAPSSVSGTNALWYTPNQWTQEIWYASLSQLYDSNFPDQDRFSNWGTPKHPLVIQNAPTPPAPKGAPYNTVKGGGSANWSNALGPVSYWEAPNGPNNSTSQWSYTYQVFWGNNTPDPYYYNIQHQGAQFFGKNAVIYTTQGGTWQYCAEAYYSFGYVNMNTDWSYDSNGQMFLNGNNLNIAQGLFASNNGANYLAALGGGSSLGTPDSEGINTGAINGNAVGMPVPWSFLAIPQQYTAISAAAGSGAVGIWPNILLFGQANLEAETNRLGSIYVPDTYNNGLSTLMNTQAGVGVFTSGGLIDADSNNSVYIDGLATWLQGQNEGTLANGQPKTYSVTFDWSGQQTYLADTGSITTTTQTINQSSLPTTN